MNIFNKETLDESIPININKSSLWSRIFSGEENQLYSDVIVKGLVWVVMFIVSFVALFIVFNDNFMKQKEIVVVNNKDQTDYYSTDTSSDSSNSTNFSFNSYSNNSNTEILDSKSKNLSLPSSSNTALPLNENSTTEAKNVISNSNSSTNNSESNNKSNNSTKTTFSNPNINSLINKSINNTKVAHQSTNNIVHNNNVLPSTINSAVKKSDYSKAWLVVIYSGNKENLVKQKWQQLNKQYPNLFANKKPYFIRIDIPNKGVYYRISLGDLNTNKALPYFSSKDEAISYCKYLVNNKLSCFIMATKKNVLGDLLFNQ